MEWRYSFEWYIDGVKVVERCSEGYAELNSHDWIFESQEEAIKILTVMLSDLKKEIGVSDES